MDREFLAQFLTETHFPPEAADFLLGAYAALGEKGQQEALEGAVETFYTHELDLKLIEPLIGEMAEAAGPSPYTVWLLFLIGAARPAKELYRDRGISEEVFWATFEDMKYKALECKAVHGVWGTFVAFWYPIFFSCDIVKLGRLEYETTVYDEDQPYEKDGIVLKKGDPILSIHIPSSGEPFDEAARLASYRLAYDFFREERKGGPLVCQCGSWLLYPPYREILSPASNIVSFQGDFDIAFSQEEEKFHDAWRVFGADYEKPAAELPEKTSMQRAFKRWLLEGKKTGEGFGVLVFDGERIVK